MSGKVELQDSWTTRPLGEVVQLVKDKVEPADVPDAYYVGLEHVQANTMRLLGHGLGSDVRSSKTKFSAGDVLYGKLRPYLNKVVRPSFDGISSTDFLVFRESEQLDSGYLAHFLNQLSVAEYAHNLSAGVELPRVNWKSLAAFPIAFPTSKETQRAVVAEVEQARGLATGASGQLIAAARSIERFRRAAFGAASSGRLTADWRVMRGRIDDNLTPGGWTRTSIGSVVECLDSQRRPINAKERALRFGDVPYFGANGQVGWIDERLFDEDLVLVVEDETFRGRTKPFSYRISGPSWVNNHAHVLRPADAITADMLNILLSYYDFVPLTSGSTGRQKLTKAALVGAPLLVPPADEQARIVNCLTELLRLADRVTGHLNEAARDVERTSQAILAKAFRGALTTSS